MLSLLLRRKWKKEGPVVVWAVEIWQWTYQVLLLLWGTDIWCGAHYQGSGYLWQDSMDTHDLGNQLVGSGMHNGGGKVWCGWYTGCRSEGALVGRVRIGGWGMGLAHTNYVCVCCEDANERMPSRVLVDCLVQSRGVFCHWSEHWVSRYFLYDFSLLSGLERVTLCDIGELGSLRGGSTCPTALCMRSSSVSEGTACSSGCHKHQRKCWMSLHCLFFTSPWTSIFISTWILHAVTSSRFCLCLLIFITCTYRGAHTQTHMYD